MTDLRDEAALAATLADLDGLPITYTLGRHDEEDFRWADIVVRNPAVPRESPWLALARSLGKRIEMEMTLFFRACPAPILGVTGTKGKTTTSTLLGQMLRERWPDAVLAGNMAVSALGQLPSIRPDTPVALELSSFQLEALDEQCLSPHVAVITNISPDHLDRYESFDDYAWVKGAVARHQTAADWLVVPERDPVVERVVDGAQSQRVSIASPVVLSRSEGPPRSRRHERSRRGRSFAAAQDDRGWCCAPYRRWTICWDLERRTDRPRPGRSPAPAWRALTAERTGGGRGGAGDRRVAGRDRPRDCQLHRRPAPDGTRRDDSRRRLHQRHGGDSPSGGCRCATRVRGPPDRRDRRRLRQEAANRAAG